MRGRVVQEEREAVLVVDRLDLAGLADQGLLTVVLDADHVPVPVQRVGREGRLLRFVGAGVEVVAPASEGLLRAPGHGIRDPVPTRPAAPHDLVEHPLMGLGHGVHPLRAPLHRQGLP